MTNADQGPVLAIVEVFHIDVGVTQARPDQAGWTRRQQGCGFQSIELIRWVQIDVASDGVVMRTRIDQQYCPARCSAKRPSATVDRFSSAQLLSIDRHEDLIQFPDHGAAVSGID